MKTDAQLKHDVKEEVRSKPNYQSINPYDGKILKTFEQLTDLQLETALQTAATCFETWGVRVSRNVHP